MDIEPLYTYYLLRLCICTATAADSQEFIALWNGHTQRYHLLECCLCVGGAAIGTGGIMSHVLKVQGMGTRKYEKLECPGSLYYYPHMPIGKVWIYCLLFVCVFFVCLFVCTVTDFSTEDKASDVKFCTVVHRRPRQGISRFCEICCPRSPKLDESASMRATPTVM